MRQGPKPGPIRSPRARRAKRTEAAVFIDRSHRKVVALPLLELRQRDGHRQDQRHDVADRTPVGRRRRRFRLLVGKDLVRRNVGVRRVQVVHQPRDDDARLDAVDAYGRPRRQLAPAGLADLHARYRQRGGMPLCRWCNGRHRSGGAAVSAGVAGGGGRTTLERRHAGAMLGGDRRRRDGVAILAGRGDGHRDGDRFVGERHCGDWIIWL